MNVILSNKVLFSIFTNEKRIYLIINRFIRRNQVIFGENNLLHDEKPKGKITVIKRKFLSNKPSSVIQWKRAANVIKRLNSEYKCLYGPVQTSDKTKQLDLSEVYKNQIIQHETRIPLIEPDTNYNSQIFNKEQKIDLSSLISFPLVNKCVYPADKINKLNFLRKHLESFCKGSAFPSVSLILQNTMTKERKKILDKWKQNKICELGEEGFEKYQAENLANGVSLHHAISSFLVSAPESELHIKEENIGHWKSLKYIFPNIKDVKLIEEFVTHPFLCYKGVVDCLARYKDYLVVIDWKASKKSKADIKNTYDDPLQIAAYIGALNFDPKYQYLASKGLIVVAYENGMPATAHFLDESTMEHYWNEWLLRVKQFWEMRISDSETT